MHYCPAYFFYVYLIVIWEGYGYNTTGIKKNKTKNITKQTKKQTEKHQPKKPQAEIAILSFSSCLGY